MGDMITIRCFAASLAKKVTEAPVSGFSANCVHGSFSLVEYDMADGTVVPGAPGGEGIRHRPRLLQANNIRPGPPRRLYQLSHSPMVGLHLVKDGGVCGKDDLVLDKSNRDIPWRPALLRRGWYGPTFDLKVLHPGKRFYFLFQLQNLCRSSIEHSLDLSKLAFRKKLFENFFKTSELETHFSFQLGSSEMEYGSIKPLILQISQSVR